MTAAFELAMQQIDSPAFPTAPSGACRAAVAIHLLVWILRDKPHKGAEVDAWSDPPR
jgi:hypothetical protein